LILGASYEDPSRRFYLVRVFYNLDFLPELVSGICFEQDSHHACFWQLSRRNRFAIASLAVWVMVGSDSQVNDGVQAVFARRILDG